MSPRPEPSSASASASDADSPVARPRGSRPAAGVDSVGGAASAGGTASRQQRLFAASPDQADARSRYLRVVPEQAIDSAPEGLTYRVPAEDEAGISAGDLAVGDRVAIPLGSGDRRTWGYVAEMDIALDPGLPASRIKPIVGRDANAPRLGPGLVDLARWMASYYQTPLGPVLATMLPAAVKRGIGRKTRQYVRLAVEPDEGTAGSDGSEADRLGPKQRAVLEIARRRPETAPGGTGLDARVLARLAGAATPGPVRSLVERGRLESLSVSAVVSSWLAGRDPDEVADPEVAPVVAPPLTDEQTAAVAGVRAELEPEPRFGVHVLHGVTGSGKTEVYLALIERVRAAGRCAIVLVPEIALTPQTARRFLARFPDDVAILHSGLTAAQRHEQWVAVREGRAGVVVGARSAVFAPFEEQRLGLIVVDEEHDGSYKQDQAPRYHARDVAIRRAQQAGAVVLLGSATPALETWHNAHGRRTFRWHRLTRRIPGAVLPKVEIVDLVEEGRARPRTDRRLHLLGPKLEHGIGRALDEGGQVILLLNRRGYANYISCPDQRCGWVLYCDACDAAMVYHKDRRLPRGGVVRCHHCLAEQRLPEACPECGRRVVTFGLGTQRIEEELARKFPVNADDGTLLRMDSDSMNRALDYHRALERFRRGEVRVLVGTQMIAKGLDFPNVRLVGVINADTAINLPDFRAGERTFQLVAQVAGRCGRGSVPGRVIVQTFQPDRPEILFAARHDYDGFARDEFACRHAAGLPPATRMARIVVRDVDHVRAAERARDLADRLQGHIAALEKSEPDAWSARVRVQGPAPCPLSRIAEHHRWSLEVIAPTAATIQRLLVRLRNERVATSDAKTAIDVDPIDLL